MATPGRLARRLWARYNLVLVLWDSGLHKADLAEGIHYLERLNRDFETDEERLLAFEQFVFWTAFVIRKLADSAALSDELEARPWRVDAYPRRPSRVVIDVLNWHHVERHYDLSGASPRYFTLRELCGLLIHSYVFVPAIPPRADEPQGVLFNSDRTKEEAVFFLGWEELRSLVCAVYDDDIVHLQLDHQTGRMVKSSVLPRD